jgi:acyl-CoA reductase-like NAD-dependent aldehyde dehydrogenase
MARKYGLYVNGQYVHTLAWRPVFKSTQPDDLLGEVALYNSAHDDPDILDAALEGLSQTFDQIRSHGFFPLTERLAFLKRLKLRLEDQKENLAQLMMHEVAKPISLCRVEVDRAIETLHWTLEESEELLREHPLPFAGRPGWQQTTGYAVREPRGPLLALSPFNFPLNLVMHKLAPAIASGCPVLLKPSPKAALLALCLVDYCHAEGLPPGMLNFFSCVDGDVPSLIRDPRIAQVSFTGSEAVGWKLRDLSTKPITLELGGAAPVFVGADANLENAAHALALSAVSYAGQTCISAQSIHVEAPAWEAFREIFERHFASLEWGLPSLEAVVCGPVVDEAARTRLERLKQRLKAAGAQLHETPRAPLQPERIEKLLVRPAFVTDLPADDAFYREECFGPLVALRPTPSLADFVKDANALPSRLQTSVWGANNSAALAQAARELDYGGVVINQSPSLRFDAMPYGGRGRAGVGREGPRYALEEFTQWKSVVSKL